MSLVFPDEIAGAFFCLVEDVAQVFTDDADGNELDASKEENRNHERRIALYRVAVEYGLYNNVYKIQKCHERHDDAENRSKSQWCGGERGDTCKCEVQQSVVAPLALAMIT